MCCPVLEGRVRKRFVKANATAPFTVLTLGNASGVAASPGGVIWKLLSASRAARQEERSTRDASSLQAAIQLFKKQASSQASSRTNTSRAGLNSGGFLFSELSSRRKGKKPWWPTKERSGVRRREAVRFIYRKWYDEISPSRCSTI